MFIYTKIIRIDAESPQRLSGLSQAALGQLEGEIGRDAQELGLT